MTKATHWIAYKDKKSIIRQSITPNKLYPLKLIESQCINSFGKLVDNSEYLIIDDTGKWCMHYMVHKGDFIVN